MDHEAARYRVTAPMVSCRTGNSLGLPGAGAFVSVHVDRGQLLPADAPAEDVARLLHKGAVEPIGEVPDEVVVLVAEHGGGRGRHRSRRRCRCADALSTAFYRAGVQVGDYHAELLAALAAFIDETACRGLARARGPEQPASRPDLVAAAWAHDARTAARRAGAFLEPED